MSNHLVRLLQGTGTPRGPSNANGSMDDLSKLQDARRRGDLEQIDILMNKPFIKDIFMGSMLQDVALFEKNPAVADFILNLPNVSINAPHYGHTLLNKSIEAGNKVTFDILLNHKDIDVNKESHGVAPIIQALRSHRYDFVNRLLEHPKIEITDPIRQTFIDEGKVDLLFQSPLPGKLLTGFLTRTMQNGRAMPNLASMLESRRKHTFERRRHIMGAWARARAPEMAEAEAGELQHQAAQLRGQLASPALTPAQKAGIAARSRAFTKKANNLLRNSRRRRNTRRGRKY